MRVLLDGLYRLCAGLAALCLVAICGLTLAQVAGRPLGTGIPSANEMSGYLVLASTFLALAPSFRFGTHIRVKLILERLPSGAQRFFEFLSLLLAIALACFAAWWCVDLVGESLRYGDLSPGRLGIPVAIPQSAMAAGLVVFAVSLLDCLVELIRRGALPYERNRGLMEDAS